MKQVIFASTSVNNDGNNIYNNPFIMRQWDSITFEGQHQIPILVAGVFRNWKIRRTTAPGAGTSVTYTIRKNGSNTALAVTISDTSLVGQDISNSVSFNIGDQISLVCNYTGGVAASPVSSALEFESSGGNDSIYGLTTHATGVPTDLQFSSIFNGAAAWDSTAANVIQVVPIDGTLVEYRAKIDSAPGGGNSVEYSIYKNGVKQDGSGGTPDTRLTINQPNTTGTATFSLSLVAGDYVYVQCDYTGAITRAVSMGFRFTPSEPNQYVIAAITPALGTVATTNYCSPTNAANEAMDTTESVKYQNGGTDTVRLSKMYVRLSAAPGAGDSREFRVRQNLNNGGLRVLISDTDTEGNDVSNIDNIQPTDLWDLRHVATGTPTSGIAAISLAAGVSGVAAVPFMTTIGMAR